MAEMNPIVQTMLQILQARQQDEELERRKQEDTARNQFAMEELKRAQDLQKYTQKRDDINFQLEKFKLEEGLRQQVREDIASGLRKPQGVQENTPRYQISNLPTSRERPPISEALLQRFPALAQPVDYDLQEEDIAQPPIVPNLSQLIQGPFGPVEVPDVVSYPERQAQKLAEGQQALGLGVLKAGATKRAEALAVQPTELEKIAKKAIEDRQLEEYKAENARALQELKDKAALERTQVTASSRRASVGTTAQVAQEDIEGLAQDAKFGGVKLGSTNQHLKARSYLRNNGDIALEPADASGMQDGKNLQEVITALEQVQPKLGTNMFSAVMTAAKALRPDDPVRRAMNIITSRAPLLANVFGVKGTQSDRDIANILKGVGNSLSTQKDIAANIAALKSQLQVNVLDVRLRGMSNAQKGEELLHFGYNLNDFNRPITDTTGKPIIINGKPELTFKLHGDRWTAYDPKSKNWEYIQ
jgi:hypothetical protein